MKKYLTAIEFKFGTRLVASLLVLAFVLLPHPIESKDIRFTEIEKTIISSVIARFKKECGHISSLDQVKLQEIQKKQQEQTKNMSDGQNDCYKQFLSQLVGSFNVYKQSCDEVTPKKKWGSDSDLARIFVNVRRYQNGIRIYHERLNECLIRRDATKEMMLQYSDYELNNRLLSKKVREIEMGMPFQENGVDFR